MKRNLSSLHDFTRDEIIHILNLTEKLKKDRSFQKDALNKKNIGLVFQKPSNRTRVSFEVGISQLGGNCIYLGPEEINLGVRESTSDVSQTLSRYLDCIIARTHTHQDLIDITTNASIPIVNGLSDLYHPCQALTDIFSIREKKQSLENITIAYIGDGNNVCNSLLLASVKLGIHMNIASPHNYEIQSDILDECLEIAKETGSKVTTTLSPVEATTNADVIYSDVWVSMGQEKEAHQRIVDFNDFQINTKLVENAKDDYIFMHCLPAHRGQEVTEEVIDGEHSIIFDQAENRLHTQKAILLFLMTKTQ